MKVVIVLEDVQPDESSPANLAINTFQVAKTDEVTGITTPALALAEFLDMAIKHYFDHVADKSNHAAPRYAANSLYH